MIRPDAAQLLTTARNALLAELLPALPENLHYSARMIANAMRISSREIAAGETCDQLTQNTLSQLCNGASGDSAELERRLAEDIRIGRFDHTDKQQALLRGLLAITHERLSISNPKLIRQA